MNIRDINPNDFKPQHYNRLRPRVRQAEHRAKKSGYRPGYTRALHDEPGKGGKTR